MGREYCAEHSGIAEAIENLESWQKTQNGSLSRIDDKVDRLLYWIMGEMAALLMLAIGVWLKR